MDKILLFIEGTAIETYREGLQLLTQASTLRIIATGITERVCDGAQFDMLKIRDGLRNLDITCVVLVASPIFSCTFSENLKSLCHALGVPVFVCRPANLTLQPSQDPWDREIIIAAPDDFLKILRIP